MNNKDEDLSYSDASKLKQTVEQQNGKTTTYTRYSSNSDTTFAKESQTLTPDRRRVRVQFAYSLDNDRLSPITQTTIVKSEPCFKVTATEDEVTKHFYLNKSEFSSREQKISQFVQQRVPSEADSLEDEKHPTMLKERKTTSKIIDMKHSTPDRTASSSSMKSILKKPQKKQEEISISKTNRSLRPSSLSPSSASKNKQKSSTHLDHNEVQYLANITAKQKTSPPSLYPRSLFSQTMNIFDPDNRYGIPSSNPRPSRLQYYMKPYRGEPYGPTNTNKQRSRSLPQNRYLQPSSTQTRWYTSSNQYARPSSRQSNRQPHLSWSPVREYIHERKDDKIIIPTKRKKMLSDKTNSSLLSPVPSRPFTSRSSRNSASIISIPIHFQKSQSSQFPSPISPTNSSCYIPSIIDRSRTPVKPILQNMYNKELGLSLPDMVYQHKREHNETMYQYNRLLDKMRTTDEELQLLSRSWINSTIRQRTPVRNDNSANQQVRVERESNLLSNKTTNNTHFFSPIILQMCLVILVILNLLIAYFFNEIYVWWSEHVAPTLIGEEHDEDNFNI